jgi:hypothetical protein
MGILWCRIRHSKKGGWWWNSLVCLRNEEQKNEVKKGKRLGSFLREIFWISLTWWRKAIDGECRLGSFDELLSFWWAIKLRKGKTKGETRVFTSVPQGEVFDLLFVDKRDRWWDYGGGQAQVCARHDSRI